MFEFLDRVPSDKLANFIARETSDEMRESLRDLDRKRLYDCLFAIKGFDALYEKGIRRLLLESASPAEIIHIAKSLGVDSTNKKQFDLAVSIGSKSWRAGGKLANVFKETFGIHADFLPSANQKQVSVETIEPIETLPALFDYQKDVSEQIFACLNEKNIRSLLVQLPTGSGKTRTSLDAVVGFMNSEIALGKSRSVIWAAHTEELCEQAIDSFRRTWRNLGTSEVCVARLWGDSNPSPDDLFGTFIVAGYQKLATLKKNDNELFERLARVTSVFIIDEAHKALAATIEDLITGFQDINSALTLVGLTATPGRGKESVFENRRLAEIFDNNLITTKVLGDDPISELQNRGILADIKIAACEYDNSTQLTKEEEQYAQFANDLPNSLLNRLARNEKRNDLIASIVRDQLKEGNPTLIFACTVEHAKTLAIVSAIQGAKAASIDCKMKRGLRHRVITSFKNNEIDVLCNYGVLSTGFDAPNLKTIIIARPTSSIVLYSQMIGRGLRGKLVGGTKSFELIDIRDNFESFGDIADVYSYFENYWK